MYSLNQRGGKVGPSTIGDAEQLLIISHWELSVRSKQSHQDHHSRYFLHVSIASLSQWYQYGHLLFVQPAGLNVPD